MQNKLDCPTVYKSENIFRLEEKEKIKYITNHHFIIENFKMQTGSHEYIVIELLLLMKVSAYSEPEMGAFLSRALVPKLPKRQNADKRY